MQSGFEITAIVIMIVLGIIVVIQMIAITVLLLVAKNLVQAIRERIDPLITKVNSLLLTANELAQTVQGKTEHIAEKAAHTSDVVADRVERTSGLVQGMVAAPIIHSAAFAEGIARGVRSWRAARQRRAGEPTSPADQAESAAPESAST
ncbi:MAG TPA: DUF948 domain-containing protein, partial [Armatimonadota bacterium]